jgi:beta-lactamase regulating signal transducer with metallopeptidase domain
LVQEVAEGVPAMETTLNKDRETEEANNKTEVNKMAHAIAFINRKLSLSINNVFPAFTVKKSQNEIERILQMQQAEKNRDRIRDSYYDHGPYLR